MDCLQIHGCLECSQTEAEICTQCDVGLILNYDANVCECVRESGRICPDGQLCVKNQACAYPDACFRQSAHCLECELKDPRRCALCSDGLLLDEDTGKCLCGDFDCAESYMCVNGECVEQKTCLAIPFCTACKSDNLAECVACESGSELSIAGTCNCGAATCADGQWCIDGVCSDGSCIIGPRAIKHCIACDTEDKFECIECGDQLRLRGNVCECHENYGYDCGDGASCVYDEQQCYVESECFERVENCEECASVDVRRCGRCETGFVLNQEGTACMCGETGHACENPFYCINGECVYSACKALTGHVAECAISDPRLVFRCTDGHVPSADGSQCLCNAISCKNNEYCEQGECVESCRSLVGCAECASLFPERCIECAADYFVTEYGLCKCNDEEPECQTGFTCISGECTEDCTSLDSNCLACIADDPLKCEICRDSYQLDPLSRICRCGDGDICGNGESCISGVCATDCKLIPHCELCSADDPLKCAECSPSTQPNHLGTLCGCGPLSLECDNDEICQADKCLCGDAECIVSEVCIQGKCEDDCMIDVNCVKCDVTDRRRCAECLNGGLSDGRCSTGLSTGEITGIVIGVLLFAAIAIAAFWVLYRKYKRGGVGKSLASEYLQIETPKY